MSRSAKLKRPSAEVVRDATFVRFIADKILINEIGRDLEVSFLQYGPILTRITDHEEHEAIDSKMVVTEVARMRTDYPALVSAMMAFLREGITGGRLKRDSIMESIQQWGDETGSSVIPEQADAQ